jgi:phosphoribosylglycinamide formyltransferase 2
METKIGTPFTKTSTLVMLCGSGELGKEVVIELQRLGAEVVAVDSYENAPAHQVADHSAVIDMLDENQLRDVIVKYNPNIIVPEIEAIATNVLKEAEDCDRTVIPNARAVQLTMNREGIRTLVAEELGLKTSKYKFASTKEEFVTAVNEISLRSSVDDHFLPCVVKPIMSSSGKGQSVVRSFDDVHTAWDYAQTGGRAGAGRVIVEEFIEFDYEITLLTVKHNDGISFCEPIGHEQVDGDYIKSWQPHPMSGNAREKAQDIARSVVSNLGGYGVFGVELFVKGDEVYFSEVSPRPHDTGLVTMISQDLSEFALHARAILGLPIPNILQLGFGASHVIKLEGKSDNVTFSGFEGLKETGTQVRLFGKPGVNGSRRMGVALAIDNGLGYAKEKAERVALSVKPKL